MWLQMTKRLPRCHTFSDPCTGNPLIATCSCLLALLPNLMHTVFIGLNVISNYLCADRMTTVSMQSITHI